MTTPVAMDTAVQQIDQVLPRMVLVAEMLGCGIVIVKVVGVGMDGYPPWFVGFVVSFLLAVTLVSATLHLRGSTTARADQAYVVACAAAMVAHVWVWEPTAAFPVPPMDNVLAIGMGLAALAFGWAGATVVVALFAATYLMILRSSLGWIDTVGIAATTGLAGAACIAARQLVDRARGDLHRAEAQLRTTTDFRQIAERRRLALVTWKDILHGKVIGSFLAASHISDPDKVSRIRDQASDALAALSGISPTPRPFAQFVLQTATANGLELSSHVVGDWSPDGPVEAIRSAVSEALVNVALHSGQRAVKVSAQFQGHHWTATVEDSGVGFDTISAAPRRGLQVSLSDPMTTIGGTSTIRSSPGHGTRVTLDWSGPARLAAPTTAPSARWLLAIAAASLCIHIVLGWALRGATQSPALLVAGALAMCLLLGLAATGHQPGPLVVGMILVQLTLAANIRIPIADPWAIWFAGGLAGFSGVLAYRGRLRWAITVVIACWLGTFAVLAVDATERTALALSLAGVYAGALVSSVFAFIGWTISLSHSALQQQAQEREVAFQESAGVMRSSKQWADENRNLITRVTPTLEQLAQAHTIPADLREDCRVLEAGCRDQLTAPTLVTQETAAALEGARRRGATVRLSAPPDGCPEVQATLRELLLTALRPHSLRELTLSVDPDDASLLMRATRSEIPLAALAQVAPLDDVLELPDGLLARFAHAR